MYQNLLCFCRFHLHLISGCELRLRELKELTAEAEREGKRDDEGYCRGRESEALVASASCQMMALIA